MQPAFHCGTNTHFSGAQRAAIRKMRHARPQINRGTLGPQLQVLRVPARRPGAARVLPGAMGISQPFAVSITSSMNNASMPDLRNVTIASIGVQTIGSLSLKDVLMTTGTPVFSWKQEMSS